jgi:hypothetical protein
MQTRNENRIRVLGRIAVQPLCYSSARACSPPLRPCLADARAYTSTAVASTIIEVERDRQALDAKLRDLRSALALFVLRFIRRSSERSPRSPPAAVR